MYKERTLGNIFAACREEGSFIVLTEMDKEQARAMFGVALIDWATAQEWAKKAPKESGQWNAIYKLYYDILHSLGEAFVYFDKIKVRTHECLFAYLCEKHPELEFNWDFFDKIRTKRKGIQYYGRPANYSDWKEIGLQTNIYISTLKRAIEERLK